MHLCLKSLYDRIDATLSGISKKLSVSLDKINKLLSDKNIKNITLTIKNTKDITANINRSKADITAAIKNFVKISLKISSSSDAFKNMSISIKNIAQKNIKKLTSQIVKTSKATNSLIADIIKSIKNGDYNLKVIYYLKNKNQYWDQEKNYNEKISFFYFHDCFEWMQYKITATNKKLYYKYANSYQKYSNQSSKMQKHQNQFSR